MWHMFPEKNIKLKAKELKRPWINVGIKKSSKTLIFGDKKKKKEHDPG